jgi:hypothetical protein
MRIGARQRETEKVEAGHDCGEHRKAQRQAFRIREAPRIEQIPTNFGQTMRPLRDRQTLGFAR